MHHGTSCAVLPMFLPDVAGKKVENLQVPADQQPVFSITPEKVLVPSKETTAFLITGLSNKAGMHCCSPFNNKGCASSNVDSIA